MGNFHDGPDREILVSIIVLTKNGEKYLHSLLDGLRRQSLFERAEIIVIDSGSTDRTLQIIARYPVALTQIPPEPLAKTLEAGQMAAIRFPQGSLVGDWKRGRRIAQSGRGLQWNDGPQDVAGGSCYNCHQLSPQEASHGTLGPSLLGFGKLRGNTPETQKYAYGRIYNSKAYNLCSQMPRLGHSGTLSEPQIKDLVAYLVDPESPVNK